MNRTGRFKQIIVRLLGNSEIVNWLRPVYDEYTLAVHILGSAPLLDSDSKVVLAKNAGVFLGSPQYYETIPSGRRYFAWDGAISSVSLDHGHCMWPDVARQCGAFLALPLLFALGMAFGRTVILPNQLDMHAHRWGAEAFFDVIRFERDARRKDLLAEWRESSFLSNGRLRTINMYPIVRLWVHADGWAAVQEVHCPNSSPRTLYLNVRDQLLADVLAALLARDVVFRAKTLFVRLATHGNEFHKIWDKLQSHHLADRHLAGRAHHLMSGNYFCNDKNLLLDHASTHFSVCRTGA